MRFSYDWISQYVDHGADARTVAERLTAAGLAVEEIEERAGDALFEVDVTTNRPDAMSHLGLAREVAVLFDRPLRLPATEVAEEAKRAAEVARVELDDPRGCPRYVARVVEEVEVGPSPDWLVARLEAIGQRSINNVVDVTNLVLWESGQPIHAFDLAKLARSTIVVRRARAGEWLVTLDGENRELDPEVLVIADADRAVALAGIMGGLDSEVTEKTVDVLIESAHFDPRRVRAGARRLGLHTDASHRFERGADPEGCRWAADRVAKLIVEVAGGRVLAGAVDQRNEELDWRLEGRLELERLNRFAGAEIAAADVERWLAGLGFTLAAEGNGVWRVAVPTWRYYDFRPDDASPPGVAAKPVYEADLFEEAVRHHGYDRIAAALPAVGGPDEGTSRGHARRRRIGRLLAACGYTEAINFAFHDEAALGVYPSLAGDGEPVRLANPISELYTVMRRSLLPGLVEAARFNQRRGAAAVSLFEIGHVFPGGEAAELETVALVTGGAPGTPWDGSRAGGSEIDLFDLKGAVELLAERFAVELEARSEPVAGFARGTACRLVAASGDETLGFLGRLAAEEGPYPLYAAELRTAPFDDLPVRAVEEPSRHPGIGADLTLTHAIEIAWRDIAAEITAARSPDLVAFGLKDRYQGPGVPQGAVNTTIRFLYNAGERSLTQEEVNRLTGSLAERLERRFAWPGGA